MLGIRQYKTIAFDLWLGELEDFFSHKLCIIADSKIELLKNLQETSSATKIFYIEKDTQLQNIEIDELISLLDDCKKENIRHLSIFIDSQRVNKHLQKILPFLKERIDQSLWPEHLKRISFISNHLESYTLQEDFVLNFFEDIT